MKDETIYWKLSSPLSTFWHSPTVSKLEAHVTAVHRTCQYESNESKEEVAGPHNGTWDYEVSSERLNPFCRGSSLQLASSEWHHLLTTSIASKQFITQLTVFCVCLAWSYVALQTKRYQFLRKRAFGQGRAFSGVRARVQNVNVTYLFLQILVVKPLTELFN